MQFHTRCAPISLTLEAHDLLSGGPGWIRSELFAVQALTPAGSPTYTLDQLRKGDAPKLQMMIQTLMADRFRLVLHHETREMPVYALTVADSGPKLRRFMEGSCVNVDPDKPPVAPPPRGMPVCDSGGVGVKGANLTFFAVGRSFADFPKLLGLVLDRPIIDRTGITGIFDAQMEFAPDGTRLQFLFNSAGARGGPGIPSDPSTPSIFTAIQEQLGLKLESTRGPVEVLVIDSVEPPTEN